MTLNESIVLEAWKAVLNNEVTTLRSTPGALPTEARILAMAAMNLSKEMIAAHEALKGYCAPDRGTL